MKITGYVRDASSAEPLQGATVRASEHLGTFTDGSGRYELFLDTGTWLIQVSYVGYVTAQTSLTLPEKNIDMDFFLEVQGIDEVRVFADVAAERETPVAFSSLSGKTLNEMQGTQELPIVLNTTPGVFSQQAGGGFGDTPFTIRGFSERNISVLVDGIQINDMERGSVFWSDWCALNGILARVQVQRGLGASKLAVTSIGGTTNMVTEGVRSKPEIDYTQYVGSDGYLSEELGFNSGMLKNDWGFVLHGQHISGDGWIDQTWVDAWGYFGKVEKKWGSHNLSLSAIGSPQKHGINVQRHPIATYDSEFALDLGVSDSLVELTSEKGHRYNENWGVVDRITINGTDTTSNVETVTERENYYHKRQFSLKDFWMINNRMAWSNVVYLTMGDAGGRTFNVGTIPLDANGQRDYQSAYNKNVSLAAVDTLYSDSEHKSSAIRRTDVNEHIQYGLLSTLNLNINENWKYTGGIDLRSYTADHFSIVHDLLGGDYYIDKADKNQLSPVKREGDKMLEDYTSKIKWAGVFNQIEYDRGPWKFFGNVNMLETGFRREDYFKKKDLVLDDTVLLQAVGTGDTVVYDGTYYTNQSPEARNSLTPWVWIPGLAVKTGFNYNINSEHNLFMNAGYANLAPRFGNVFESTNRERDDYENQYAYSAEAGYGYVQRDFSAHLNLYYLIWNNKPNDALRTFTDAAGVVHFYNLNGLNARHAGIELEAMWRPLAALTLKGILALGDWRWTSMDTVEIYDESGNILDTVAYDATDVHVGNAAQQQFGIYARYEFIRNLWMSGDYTYFTKYFADFDPFTLNSTNDYFATHDNHDSWKAPGYGLLNLHAGYQFVVFKNFRLGLGAHVLNVLRTRFVVGMVNGAGFDAATARVYWGKGTTYSISMQLTYF